MKRGSSRARSPARWRRALAASLVLALPLLGGCGTVVCMTLQRPSEPRLGGGRLSPLGAIYCGVAFDVWLLEEGPAAARALAIVDLPFSLLADTALLPFTAVLELRTWWWSRQFAAAASVGQGAPKTAAHSASSCSGEATVSRSSRRISARTRSRTANRWLRTSLVETPSCSATCA